MTRRPAASLPCSPPHWRWRRLRRCWARTTDRSKPMNVDADHQQRHARRQHGHGVLTGDVHITQGTLDIQCGKAVIYRAQRRISRAVLTGSPVVLKQEMDDGAPMTRPRRRASTTT